jgi:hypothetical protein
MSSNVVNQVPYLRTSRNFPEEAQPLAVEVNKSYVDIANAVNNRVIGIFPTNVPAVNGESWFISSGKRQQALRKVFLFTGAGNIPHGLTWTSVAQISPNSYGSFTDGINWYGAVYDSNTTFANRVTFYVTPTNIVVLSGAGAPTISSGLINLEWLSQP